MSDIDLCRIDGLTDEQLAGIDVLGAMTVAEVEAFVDAFGSAWDANREAVTAAKARVGAAIAGVHTVELETADAARARNARRPVLSQGERDACDATLNAYHEALEAHEAAKQQFKAGVTEAQLEALL